ncbi:Putative Bacterial regulatory protein (plasmid) [Planktothrix agardhii]|jgi:hypothetical protein|uniref:hypothetical protein n=1 Tax=Planktothrix agardhii TaxID=1160 RepID=UPI001F3DBB25|nr:hypothetical protein [Planktothrix agardhii]MCF3627475.1 hypothetical protein [Planktothrix agardhii 1801]CAD5983619.1 Putative Bacterial regulatory protein [Planktothrix agardhii]
MKELTESKVKIEGKFYPLQRQEWVKACRELTSSARDQKARRKPLALDMGISRRRL